MQEQILTQSHLKKILNYCPNTGAFTQISRTSQRVQIGDSPGHVSKKDGYIRICFNGRYYLAHRLAFLYMKGAFPLNSCDHINHIRDDNRWCNLREATNSQNSRNASLRCDNITGITGVSWCKKTRKWNANITINKRHINLGRFEEKNHAIVARWMADDKYNFHQNHGDKPRHLAFVSSVSRSAGESNAN